MNWSMFWRRARRDRLFVIGGGIVAVLVVTGLLAHWVAPYPPNEQHLEERLAPPNASYWLGSDWAGRDTLSRLIHGTRITLTIAFGVVALAGLAGVLTGLVAGYFGGWLDQAVTALTNILYSFPALVLALTVAVLLGPSTQNLILVLAIMYTPNVIRITRGSVLATKDLAYVQAAQALGASTARLLFAHILPNALAPVLVQITIGFSFAILSETSLTYLGFGTQAPDASWGMVLNENRDTIWVSIWPSLFAGVFIGFAVLGFNFLGDGLRDILDPTLREA